LLAVAVLVAVVTRARTALVTVARRERAVGVARVTIVDIPVTKLSHQ
jgi:hypothetical protein